MFNLIIEIMKNFYSLLIFCCFFLSCTDDNNEAARTANSTTQLASTPEAKSIFDNSYKGIYKGIVIGNVSGTLHINILNDETIWAKFQTEDKVTYTLENIPYPDESGADFEPVMKKYRFGDENIAFEVKLDETGNHITTSNLKFFSDSSSKICLAKEKSNSLIKCYTGEYTGLEESGAVNFTSDGQSRVSGLIKKTNSPEVFAFTGEIEIIFSDGEISRTENGNSPDILYQLNANLHVGYIRGYLYGYRFDGNWMNEDMEIGNWGATRIL